MEIGPGRPPGASALLEPVIEISAQITKQGLDPSLLHLVRVQVAGFAACAACRRKQAADAQEAGVDERRLSRLPGWRSDGLYSAKERAVLAWSEAIHCAGDAPAMEAAARDVSRHCSAEEQLLLGIALLAIHQAPCPHVPTRADSSRRS